MDRIADRLEIRDLTARYAYYVDTFQTNKVMTLWTDDAVFDESRVGTGLHTGAAGIRAFFEGLKKTVTHQAHITSNHLIEEIDDTTAKGIVFSIVEAVTIAGNMRAVVYRADGRTCRVSRRRSISLGHATVSGQSGRHSARLV